MRHSSFFCVFVRSGTACRRLIQTITSNVPGLWASLQRLPSTSAPSTASFKESCSEDLLQSRRLDSLSGKRSSSSSVCASFKCTNRAAKSADPRDVENELAVVHQFAICTQVRNNCRAGRQHAGTTAAWRSINVQEWRICRSSVLQLGKLLRSVDVRFNRILTTPFDVVANVNQVHSSHMFAVLRECCRMCRIKAQADPASRGFFSTFLRLARAHTKASNGQEESNCESVTTAREREANPKP